MKKSKLIMSSVMLAMMLSCSPNFNWREFRFSDDELTFMFPCKPQEMTKEVEIGEEKQALTLAACDVGEIKFTVAKLKNPSQISPQETIELWQKASWYSAKGSELGESLVAKKIEMKINNKSVPAQTLSLDKTIKVHWQWFQKGSWTYQLGVYFPKAKSKENLSSESQEMFFRSVR